jgi:penicillin amidase
MRIVPLLVSATVTAGLVFTLNIQLKLGGTKAPRLGYFLSPQHGFWKNAEKVNTNFDATILANDLKGDVDVYMDDRLVPHIYAVIYMQNTDYGRWTFKRVWLQVD